MTQSPDRTPVPGWFDLTGRVVLVTGATRGIGRELAFHLAQAGGEVVATARTAQDAAAIEAEAADRGLPVTSVLLDVRDVGSIGTAVAEVVARHGRIDVLVNNAGLGTAHRALDVTEDDFDDMMAVNLRGTFFVSQAVARVMVPRGGGRIVMIGSQGGLVGLPDAAVYCASKGGVHQLGKVLALEWAEHGITVNTVAPTFVRTPGTAPLLDGPGLRDEVLARIPLGVLGTPADVAGAVVYLSAPASRLVTGTVLVVDGGWTAR
ncbi:SDR family oxidoreductase [Modestobacter sp. VKM Ac-2986]|uniref:SDR family NAD(P)-dependent oxidoreductase n=1 Tax=Modestobacter sp. VKM Ac-2986 TaxID=3004140 RepID=UPI0022AB820B|nr:SDR family oxidoreductase [Modestobacter sp. VKM Ac-2986]MCZ2830587.1 SDR family oxidoreductase [Modestobacter sp. VKM Ac-2986]